MEHRGGREGYELGAWRPGGRVGFFGKGLESNDVMVQKSLLNAVSQVLKEIPTPSD